MDPKASLWSASGKTLYSLGNRNTRVALEKMAVILGLTIQHGVVKRENQANNNQKEKGHKFLNFFNKK